LPVAEWYATWAAGRDPDGGRAAAALWLQRCVPGVTKSTTRRAVTANAAPSFRLVDIPSPFFGDSHPQLIPVAADIARRPPSRCPSIVGERLNFE
jgi:hypothetical protein